MSLYSLSYLFLACSLFLIRKRRNFFIILSALFAIMSYEIFNMYFMSNLINQELNLYVIFCISLVMALLFFGLQKSINYKETAFIIMYFIVTSRILFVDTLNDLIIFWELSALFAVIIIAQSKHSQSLNIALKYFYMHILGGIFLIIGSVYLIDNDIIYLSHQSFNLNSASSNIASFVLIGILFNLAIPPFYSWLSDGYSKCSPNASLVLSIFTTKAALAILYKMYYGNIDIAIFGLIIGFFGMIASALQSSLRRILAFTIIQQLGIGIIIIASITTKHTGFYNFFVFVDIFYKMILFMVAVILIKMYKTDDIYKLQNKIYYKSALGLLIMFVAVQSLGLPISAGFIAKTYAFNQIYLNENIFYGALLVLFAGNCLNLGLKVPYYLIGKNKSNQEEQIKLYLLVPAIIIAFLMQVLFFSFAKDVFSSANILSSLKVLSIGIAMFVVYIFTINKYENIILKIIKHIQNFLITCSVSILSLFTSEKFNLIIASVSKKFIFYIDKKEYKHKYFTHSLILTFVFMIILIYFVI